MYRKCTGLLWGVVCSYNSSFSSLYICLIVCYDIVLIWNLQITVTPLFLSPVIHTCNLWFHCLTPYFPHVPISLLYLHTGLLQVKTLTEDIKKSVRIVFLPLIFSQTAQITSSSSWKPAITPNPLFKQQMVDLKSYQSLLHGVITNAVYIPLVNFSVTEMSWMSARRCHGDTVGVDSDEGGGGRW